MANRQTFLASLSKSGLFFSKDFQRKLWRFWGISRAYKGSKPKGSISKFFRGPPPPFGPTSDAIEPYSTGSAAREGSSAFTRRARALTSNGGGWRVHCGASVRVGRSFNLARIPIIGIQMSAFIALAPKRQRVITLIFLDKTRTEKQQNSASFVRRGRPSRCGT